MAAFAVPLDAEAVAPLSAAQKRFSMIPTQMRNAPCWMVSPIGTKRPHAISNGRISAAPADWRNPRNHSCFETALEAIGSDQSLNLMFVLGVGNDMICIDLDPMSKVQAKFIVPAKKLRSGCAEALLGFTYCERSISGQGLHYIGRGTEVRYDKDKRPIREVEVDLLFRGCLLVTGHAVNNCTETPDISGAANNLLRDLDRQPNEDPGDTVQTVAAQITTYNAGEQRLIAILNGGKNSHAFQHGTIDDWSYKMTAAINTAAEFCTDEDTAKRVLQRSGLVQLSQAKGNETRLEKFSRLWSSEWPKALAKTEPSRRQRALAESTPDSMDDLQRIDLRDQSDFVNYRLQQRAMSLLQQGVMKRQFEAEALAPVVGYLERGVKDLEDIRRIFEKRNNERACERLTLVQSQFEAFGEKPESELLNKYMVAVVIEEAQIDRKSVLQRFNECYHIVENVGGRKMIYENAISPTTYVQNHWSEAEFTRARRADKILLGWDENGAPIVKPAANEWLDSSFARRFVTREMRYESAASTIDTPTGKILNLFRGWATQPASGDYRAIEYLIHEIICSGDQRCAKFLTDFLAHMIQKPGELPGVAVVLQSEEQGTGKSTFMDLLRELLGRWYCATTADASTFIGQFNAGALHKILLHFEEAVAPNDRLAESKIKALITNETLSYNAKGIAAIESRNYARVFMTSNAQYVTHVARHDRRMFVLRVSPKHANHRQFWSQFRRSYPEQLPAFMHHLWTRDLSSFNPSAIPQTEGRNTQKMESATGPDRILREILISGCLPACSIETDQGWTVRNKAMVKHLVEMGIIRPSQSLQMAKVLAPILARKGGVRRVTVDGHSISSWVNYIAPLPQARAKFLKHMGVSEFDWVSQYDGDWLTG